MLYPLDLIGIFCISSSKLIQEGSHNPSIDAKTAIQLVLLKLRQGIDFGDVIVNGCVNVYDENVAQNFHLDDIDMNSTASISKFIYKTGLSINQNFFNILRDNKISCELCFCLWFILTFNYNLHLL